MSAKAAGKQKATDDGSVPNKKYCITDIALNELNDIKQGEEDEDREDEEDEEEID